METLAVRLAHAVARRADAGWSGAATAEAALAALEPRDRRRRPRGGPRHRRPPVRALPRRRRDPRGRGPGRPERQRPPPARPALGRRRPARPSVAVALEVAGLPADARAARAHLGPRSPLVHYGLVDTSGTDVLLSRRVVLADRVAAHLSGDDLPPQRVLTLLLDAVPVEVEGTDLVAAALSAGQRLVWVHAPGAGAGAAMATAACRRLGVAHLVADLARLDPAASRRAGDPGHPARGRAGRQRRRARRRGAGARRRLHPLRRPGRRGQRRALGPAVAGRPAR